MDPTRLPDQMLQFQKTTTDNWFRSSNLLFEHGERLTLGLLKKTSLFPGLTHETGHLWLDMTRTWRSYCEETAHAFFDPFGNA